MRLIKNKPIDINEVLRDAMPKGVIHCGAYLGEELPIYLSHGVKNRCWIEADPDTFNELKKNIPDMDVAINVAISSWNGKGKFIVMNNGASSSLLMPKTHLVSYPTVKIKGEIVVNIRTLDYLIKNKTINIEKYDFLYMDLQGAEMMALKGFSDNLYKINYILSEINYEDVYVGCCKIDEFDNYLEGRGFKKQWATIHETVGWGDAYYKRV